MSEWDKVSRPLPGGDAGAAPPPWPSLGDPRTTECKHDWAGIGGVVPWGRKGDRQRRCRRCERWVWDFMWWPEVAPESAPAPLPRSNVRRRTR